MPRRITSSCFHHRLHCRLRRGIAIDRAGVILVVREGACHHSTARSPRLPSPWCHARALDRCSARRSCSSNAIRSLVPCPTGPSGLASKRRPGISSPFHPASPCRSDLAPARRSGPWLPLSSRHFAGRLPPRRWDLRSSRRSGGEPDHNRPLCVSVVRWLIVGIDVLACPMAVEVNAIRSGETPIDS